MLRVVAVSMVAVLLSAVAGCVKSDVSSAEAEERGSALYRKAREAEQSGDVKEAIRLYNRVLIEEPKSFSAHFQLATLLQDHEENYVGAIYHYQQYLYLRPESEKSTLAQERIRISEQLLAPQILRKVGESVQGISQAHLLKENDRLNRAITTMEGVKSVLVEEKANAEKELAKLRGDNERLRGILTKMRVSETVSEPSESILKRVEASVKTKGEVTPSAPKRLDAKELRALREEAETVSAGSAPARRPLVDVPSTEAVLKKVQTKLSGEADASAAAVSQATAEAAPADKSGKSEQTALSALALFGKDEKRQKAVKGGEPRTYVVQPGDSLFRVAEKFYGDSTHWKKIRDANRTRIDPDGRIRAGQIIVVP